MSDVILLNRFVTSRDEEACREIVHKYSAMVFNSCKNIVRCTSSAEDISQEVFLEFVRSAQNIKGSLPAWLHSVAVNKSVSFVRREKLRSKIVLNQENNQPEFEDTKWEELAPVINQEIENLPVEIKVPVILHFLVGMEQSQIASEMQVNQSTISRRISGALETLRENLKKIGLVVSVLSLSTLLANNAHAAAMPPGLCDRITDSVSNAISSGSTSLPQIDAVTEAAAKGGSKMLKAFLLTSVFVIAGVGGFLGLNQEPARDVIIPDTALEEPVDNPIGGLEVTPMDEEKDTNAEIEKKLDKMISIDCEDEDISDVFATIFQLIDAPYVIMADLSKLSVRKINLSMQEMTAREIVAWACQFVKLSWRVANGKVEIFDPRFENSEDLAKSPLERRYTLNCYSSSLNTITRDLAYKMMLKIELAKDVPYPRAEVFQNFIDETGEEILNKLCDSLHLVWNHSDGIVSISNNPEPYTEELIKERLKRKTVIMGFAKDETINQYMERICSQHGLPYEVGNARTNKVTISGARSAEKMLELVLGLTNNQMTIKDNKIVISRSNASDTDIESLKKLQSVNIAANGLEDITEKLSEITGVKVYTHLMVKGTLKLNLQFTDTGWNILNLATYPMHLGWKLTDQGVELVSNRPIWNEHDDGTKTKELEDLIKPRVSMNVEEKPLRDALKLFRTMGNPTFLVDKYVDMNTLVTFDFDDVSTKEALTDICDCAGIGWKLSQGVIKLFEINEARAERNGDIQELLWKKISITGNLSFSEVLQQVENQTGVSIPSHFKEEAGRIEVDFELTSAMKILCWVCTKLDKDWKVFGERILIS